MNIEKILNTFPEVTWDRYIEDGGNYIIYGWIDREKDQHKDFMIVFTDDETGSYYFVTSSAKYSADFSHRINPDTTSHASCKRVEDMWPAAKAIKL